MARFTSAQRRYNLRVVGFSVGYVLLLLVAAWLFNHRPPTGPLAYAVAVLPALALLGVVWAMGRYLSEESDEYVRMLETRKSLVATGFMLAVTTVWGFLQAFDLAPRVDLYWAAVLWFGGLGLGGCVQALRR